MELLAPFADEVPQYASDRTDGDKAGRRRRSVFPWLTRSQASEIIQQIADKYLQSLDQERQSPRLAKVVDEILQLAKAAKRLREQIADLSNEARSVLSPAWTYFDARARRFNRTIYQVYDRAEGQDLDLPARGRNSSTWQARLIALEQLARLTTDAFTSLYGSGDSTRPDRGGNTNYHKLMNGTAKRNLVRACWHLFEACKPGEATGTIESKNDSRNAFYRFVCAVYGCATGEDADLSGTSLTRFVTAVAGHQIRFHATLEEKFEIRRRINELDPRSEHFAPEIARSAPLDLMESLRAKEKLLEQELQKLDFRRKPRRQPHVSRKGR